MWFKQTNIFDKIELHPDIIKIYNKHYSSIDSYQPIGLDNTRDILDILCKVYQVPKLKKVYIDTKDCKKIKANAYFCVNRICFRDEYKTTFQTILHEFAHYIDFEWNFFNRMTVSGMIHRKCNLVADEFARKFSMQLWNNHRNNLI